MISTGVVRKIDDLGRIVIPKEIRKTLGIRDGENLEITVEDDKIKLSKKNIINNHITEIKELCLVAGAILPGTLMVTDRERVTNVAGNEISVKVGDKISDQLIDLLDKRMMYNDIKMERIVIGNKEFIGYYLIYPIIDDGTSLGLVILYNDKGPVKEYEILIKYLSYILSRKLDIS